MPGIASAATSVVIAHVAAGTSTIRVGAGGIMLPNHAPLVIAEQFGTLAALHPGRIDLGLGRAPGTDMATARALRRNLEAGVDSFPQDVVELLGYFAPAVEGQRVRAVPGEGQDVKVWILGLEHLSARSSRPCSACPTPSPRISRRPTWSMRSTSTASRFQPSEQLDKPYVMLGLNVFAAPTDEEARLLFTSLQQAFVNLRSGRPGQVAAAGRRTMRRRLDPMARAMLAQALSGCRGRLAGDGQARHRRLRRGAPEPTS